MCSRAGADGTAERVVGEGLYNDDKARICEDILLALFSRDFAVTYLLGSGAVQTQSLGIVAFAGDLSIKA